MCYHVSVLFDKYKLAERFNLNLSALETTFDLPPNPYINGFTFPHLYLITNQNTLKLDVMQWGLIPSWIKTQKEAEKIRLMTLNAKVETLNEKPAFRNCLKKQRCLIPISGFFEWREIQKAKYPYFIQSNENISAIAGIYEHWKNPDTNEQIKTFSMITTEANNLMAQIHKTKKRMPLIVNYDQGKQWLNEGFEFNHVTEFLEDTQKSNLKAHPIEKDFQQKAIQNSNVNLLKEVPYPELAFYPLD